MWQGRCPGQQRRVYSVWDNRGKVRPLLLVKTLFAQAHALPYVITVTTNNSDSSTEVSSVPWTRLNPSTYIFKRRNHAQSYTTVDGSLAGLPAIGAYCASKAASRCEPITFIVSQHDMSAQPTRTSRCCRVTIPRDYSARYRTILLEPGTFRTELLSSTNLMSVKSALGGYQTFG